MDIYEAMKILGIGVNGMTDGKIYIEGEGGIVADAADFVTNYLRDLEGLLGEVIGTLGAEGQKHLRDRFAVIKKF